MRTGLAFVVVAGVVSAPALVAAQSAEAAAAPRVEFGVGLATGGWFGGQTAATIDLRATGRVTRRLAIEFVADVATRELGTDRLYGFYVLQGRWLLHEAASEWRVFATFGGIGAFQRYAFPEYRFIAPDGSVYSSPARTYRDITRPTEIVGGVAVEKTLTRHLAARADAQVIVCPHGAGAGMRIAGAIAVPLGSYRGNRASKRPEQ
jgi:hypothetical protein